MTATLRKQHERQRRKAEGQVALSGWISASDHAALSHMARDSGMTQGHVVSRLIADRVETAWLIRTCASLNANAGEIGAGMLAQIVSEARRIQAVS